MGSKNLRSSGSSASGPKKGLRAWLHRKKDADKGIEGRTKEKVHLFSRKRTYSVSRSSDFNWDITRYDKQPGYESARAEFEKRRSTNVDIPKVENKVQPAENKQVPVKNGSRSTVPSLDVYFKEESIRAEAKMTTRSEPKPEVRSFRQERLFDREPKMVEAVEDETFLTGVSYFSDAASLAEAPTCSSSAEMPIQTSFADQFGTSSEEDIEVVTDIASNEVCTTVIEISEEDLFLESLYDDLATFTVMNDIMPEIMAEEESAEEDRFIDDVCEDIVAKFIVDELMPELLRKKEVPEYVISDISDVQVSETVIEVPEVIPGTVSEVFRSAEAVSFLFGFGRPAVQKNGTTGFTFVFGNTDEIDCDDEEVSSATVGEAAIAAASIMGSPIGL